MSTHADGLIDVSSEVDGLMKFGGQVLAVAMLPQEVQAAVEGAVTGDSRLYPQEDGPVYVLAVQEVYPAQPQDFAIVRDQILQRIFLTKRGATIDNWMDDLRQASEIEIHASEEQIREIVGLGPSEDQ